MTTQRPPMSTWPVGGGEMGARIRAHDWAATPLGPIESWSQSLKTAVGIMLNVPQPMWIGWGPDVIELYNDAYVALLDADQHLSAFARPEEASSPIVRQLPSQWRRPGSTAGELFWR
jgi:hypothetical protein